MKNRKPDRVLLVMLLSLSIAAFAGCEQTETSTSTTSGVPGDSSVPDKKTPSDRELDEIVKKELYKGLLEELPLEITSLSVNWTDKSADSASGKFSVKTQTTEGLYKPVDGRDALKKLMVTELYEGEVNVARGKIGTLPEPHRTNLRNAAPNNRLDRFRFFDVLVPNGDEVTLTGSVELTKYGDDWQANRIQRHSISCGDGFVPESKLQDASQLDDPKTKEAVEAIIQERKDFVAKVDATMIELENERLAEIKRQQDALDAQYKTILEYVKPDARFEGTWNCTRWGAQSTGITVVFGQYSDDMTAIEGTYYMTGHPEIWVAFQLHIKPDKIEQFPIKGKRGVFTDEVKTQWDQLEKTDAEAYHIATSFFHYSMNMITLGIVDGSLRGTFAGDTTVNLGKPVEQK